MNETLIDNLAKTEGMETSKMVVTSPISKMFTYKLSTASEIVVVHERRHLDQAERVTSSQGFPG